jgi:plasmid stability protein
MTGTDMRQVLVRDLDDATVERLKERARQHGRSLQAEVKAILQEAAAMFTMEEALANSKAWHRRLAGRKHSDSAALVREDRDR